MVHALEEIRWLLKRGGFLIDIHPIPDWLFLRAVKGENVLASEPKPMTYTQDILDAENAIRAVVERGLFVLEQMEEFDYLTYAASIDELREHWTKISAYDESPEDEFVIQQVEAQYTRFHAVLQSAGEGAEVLIHEKGRISRLRTVR